MREKYGLDYFQLDVNLSIKVEELEAFHGIVGFGIWIKLLQEIYKSQGTLSVDSKKIVILARRFGVEAQQLTDVIRTCCDAELFEKDTYEGRGILTSEGIRRRIGQVLDVRQKAKDRKAKLSQSDQKNEVPRTSPKFGEPSAENALSSANQVQRVSEVRRTLQQRREEKRREEKSRVENSVCTPTPTENPTVEFPHTHTNKLSPDKNTVFDPESLAMPASLDCPELQASWLQWCEHAKDIRLTLTRTSAQLQLAKVLELGVERFCKAVNHSICAGWKTIHEDKGGGGGVSPPSVAMTAYDRKMAMMDELIRKAEEEETQAEEWKGTE